MDSKTKASMKDRRNPVVVLQRLENLTDLKRNGSIALQKCETDNFSPLQRYGKVAAMTRYKCRLCEDDSVLFEHSTQLQDHLRETHELNQTTGECAVCCQELSKDSSLIMCNGCIYDFARTNTMSIIHQCGSCNVCFVSERDLRDHVREEHPGKKVESNARILMHEKTRSDDLDEDEKLGGNVETQEDGTTEPVISEDRQNKLIIWKVKRKKSNKGNTCNFCRKHFSRSGDLKRHIRIHTGEKPFICKFCDKCFADQTSLIYHERIHTGEKPYVCKFCKRGFANSSNLTQHERTHTREKPFKCKICQKAFTSSGNLHIHERSHTGEKPYSCKLCKKSFSQSSNLYKHKQRHHS